MKKEASDGKKTKTLSSSIGDVSPSGPSSVDPSPSLVQNAGSTAGPSSSVSAPPIHVMPKKKNGSFRSRFSLQRLLYSPLLNRRRKTLEQNAGNQSTGSGGRSNGSRSEKQAPGSSAANSNYRFGARGSSTKGSTSKNSFDDCLRYSATREGAGASSIVGCDSLSAASFSSSSCEHHAPHLLQGKREKKPGGQECPLCLLYWGPERLLTLTNCHHVACMECLAQYVLMAILEYQGNVHCFECAEFMHPSDVRTLVKKESFVTKYEDLMLRRVLASDPDTRWCPAPDCSFAVIAAGCASCPKLRCERPGCGMSFCYHCKAEWHPNQTCDAARAAREPRFRASSLSFSYDVPFSKEQIKPCPVCRSLIMKQEDGSCNHMVCSVCATEFCWLCMKQISDLHYLSPSGCTFWGKKPWSRKKKILWQVGMLIGAPVGIALIAGIAVPAIIIGIPVWVGRRIYQNSLNTTRHKRNLIIVGGVMASVLVSPVLAGAAVGFGVPMLLAYVYGVVPVSLCRSGVCGISTSASGVRLDFDEDEVDPESGTGVVGGNEISGSPTKKKFRVGGGVKIDDDDEDEMQTRARARTASGDMEAGLSQGGMTNLDGSSVGPGTSMTLSLGDGSSVNTVDRHLGGDNETASLKALAGSIASSASRGHRMEVLADVTNHAGKRNSVSSESISGALSMISSDRHSDGRSLVGVVALSDDRASNVALAGSILSYKLSGEQSYREPSAGGEVVSLRSVDAIASKGGGGGGTNASISPVSSFSTGDELFFGRRSGARNSARKSGYLERQLSLDSGSLEERVRFDDNVSFIDDHGGVTMGLSSATGAPGVAGDGQILEDVEAEEQEERKYSDSFAVVIEDSAEKSAKPSQRVDAW